MLLTLFFLLLRGLLLLRRLLLLRPRLLRCFRLAQPVADVVFAAVRPVVAVPALLLGPCLLRGLSPLLSLGLL